MQSLPVWEVNTSKGVIRSRELALATEEEIASALGKQGVIDIRRISIRKGEERIQTNTYILTFNQPYTPNELKISYCLERVGQYIPVPLRYFKCQKYWCLLRTTDMCQMQWNRPSLLGGRLLEGNQMCRQDHPAYIRSCDVYKTKNGNIWGETQEECVLPGSKENCREQHGRKQLYLYCMEGRYNQSR